MNQQVTTSISSTPAPRALTGNTDSPSTEAGPARYRIASALNGMTPTSVLQRATPSAPVAQRNAPPVAAPSPFVEIPPELAASSPSELAVDIASVLSQLTTASTAVVTSNAAVTNSVGN